LNIKEGVYVAGFILVMQNVALKFAETLTAIVNAKLPALMCFLVINLLQRHSKKIKRVLNIFTVISVAI
jgi:hypothetical protein